MIIREVREEEARGGKRKQVFMGDMYLRGVLKEQNRPLGKANFFNWVVERGIGSEVQRRNSENFRWRTWNDTSHEHSIR